MIGFDPPPETLETQTIDELGTIELHATICFHVCEETKDVFYNDISSSGGPGAGFVSGTWTDPDRKLFE